MQVENEFGFVGPNEPYLRHLIAIAKSAMGPDHILFTTDPPSLVSKGSLYGDAVLSCAIPGPSGCCAGHSLLPSALFGDMTAEKQHCMCPHSGASVGDSG